MDIPRSREFYCINKAVRTTSTLEGLRQNSSRKDSGDQNSAFPLAGLLTNARDKGVIQDHAPENPVLAEYYIQGEPDQTSQLMIKRQEPQGTFQFVLDVNSDEVSVFLPESFIWFWIAPVHHKDYQARLGKESVPAKGIGEDGLLAIRAQVNGEERILESPLLLQSAELRLSTVQLSLKMPSGSDADEIKKSLTPAKIIVGIQQ